MKCVQWSVTDRGLKRNSNQDSILVNADLGIYVLADGMGGHTGGEIASQMAVEVVQDIFKDISLLSRSPRERIEIAYKEACRKVYEKATVISPELSGMGTTMVMAYVAGKNIYIGNVGDSRCYLFRKPFVWQMTEDHSLINEQIRQGHLTEDQAKVYIGKNVITRSVGYERNVDVDIIEREMNVGEIYLLCSDGLSGLVSDDMVGEILSENPPEKAIDLCLKSALFNGGDDNVSIILLQVVENEPERNQGSV
jgi:serine/threonine protein phosphatase PrpC